MLTALNVLPPLFDVAIYQPKFSSLINDVIFLVFMSFQECVAFFGGCSELVFSIPGQ